MKPADQYRKVDIQAEVASADPHKLVDMLLVGAIAQVARARACTEHQDFQNKGIAVNAAVDIISTLFSSLDQDKGGDVAGNLAALYTYMLEALAIAHAESDTAKFSEVERLLRTVKEGWDGIREEALQVLAARSAESGEKKPLK